MSDFSHWNPYDMTQGEREALRWVLESAANDFSFKSGNHWMREVKGSGESAVLSAVRKALRARAKFYGESAETK